MWAAIKQQVAEKGATQFYGALLSVGLLYHLYNQVRSCGTAMPCYVADEMEAERLG